MINLPKILIILLAVSAFAVGQSGTKRTIDGNSIVSERLPDITVKVDKSFKYVGSFDFTIRDIAKGTRYVFADAQNKRVRRLFIAQFEEILPTSGEIYRYNFDNALVLGTHRFRHNTYAYSSAEARKENPVGEAALTEAFLKEKGYLVEDELMMSRFVTVPDVEKKHELILFYIENVAATKRKLAEFYLNDNESDIWRQLTVGLTDRSRRAFTIS